MRTGLIIVGLLCCQSSNALEVTWLKTDWPPHQITSGAHQEQGTFDLLLKQVIAQLPEMTHQIQAVNLARLEQAFHQRNKSVCTFGSIYTEERAKSRLYSKAVAVLPGLAVHFRVSAKAIQHPALQKDGTVDILQLAEDDKLTGAYQPNRFYPPSMMAATRYAGLIPHDFTSQLNAAALLASKRVDYVVEYPERMAFYLKKKQQTVGIQSVMVSDAAPYMVSHITCNKTVEAPQIIKQINTALMALWQTKAYRQNMYSWIDEPGQKALEQAFYDTKQQVINSQ